MSAFFEKGREEGRKELENADYCMYILSGPFILWASFWIDYAWSMKLPLADMF